MRNDYLDERRRSMMDRRDRMDHRMNDYYYGSMNKGSISYENMREPYDHRMNENRDYRYNDYRNDYERGREVRNYRNDYNDYAMDNMDKEYQEDLENWIEKLKRKDRIGLKENQVIEHAKQMGAKFDEYDEKEFYAVYLMLISDHKSLGNDTQKIIRMAIEWLEDDDVKRRNSEKVCTYMYKIVKGE